MAILNSGERKLTLSLTICLGVMENIKGFFLVHVDMFREIKWF